MKYLIYNHTFKRERFRFAAWALLGLTVICLSAGCAAMSASMDSLPTGGAPGREVVTFITPAAINGAATPEPAPAEGTPAGYAPAIFGSALDATPEPTSTPSATPVATLGPPLPPPTVVVAVPPIDFEAARATAQAQGLDLAFVNIGFHTGASGNTTGIGDYFETLNNAGVPIFLKSADTDGQLIEVQNLMKANEAAGRYVPHTLVFRLTDTKYEAPYYNLQLSPEEAAAVSWQLNRDNWPSGLDKRFVWFETHNEPGRYGYDGNLQIERLGRFSLATAKLAVEQGYRYAALGWSTGVPEPEDWEDPAMLEFLRYAGEHPDQVAVALHEYSLSADYIAPPPPVNQDDPPQYPYAVGRFQFLFEVCDKYGIPRPTVLITEWGWTHDTIPQPIPALEDIAWASWLYAAYPTVKGAAIWYLGVGDNGIHNQTQRLIAPLTDYAISHYFIIDPGIGRIDPNIFRPSPPTLRRPSLLENWPTPFPWPRIIP